MLLLALLSEVIDCDIAHRMASPYMSYSNSHMHSHITFEVTYLIALHIVFATTIEFAFEITVIVIVCALLWTKCLPLQGGLCECKL